MSERYIYVQKSIRWKIKTYQNYIVKRVYKSLHLMINKSDASHRQCSLLSNDLYMYMYIMCTYKCYGLLLNILYYSTEHLEGAIQIRKRRSLTVFIFSRVRSRYTIERNNNDYLTLQANLSKSVDNASFPRSQHL